MLLEIPARSQVMLLAYNIRWYDPAKATMSGREGGETCKATVPKALLVELEEWGEWGQLHELMALEELDDDMVVHCPRGCDPRDKWRIQNGRFGCGAVSTRTL